MRFPKIAAFFTLIILLLFTTTLQETPSPLETCTAEQVQQAVLPPYIPAGSAVFVRLEAGQFTIGSEPFTVRGVNYFPANYPWRRFLTAVDRATLRAEFGLLRDAGLNTLRIFLWYDALFDCSGSGAVPKVENFARLDGAILEAAAHDFHLIVTLNDAPNLTDYPLYEKPHFSALQTALIVSRYRDEPAILAWDLRNEGDIDYGSRDGPLGQRFPREQVLDWLAAESARVRSLDNNHLITAGWLHDAAATALFVDFVSFHHWWDASDMRRRVAEIRAATDKPILMEEFGYSTYMVTPKQQAENITAVINAAETEKLLGWLAWTAFDFPLEVTCWPQPCVDAENHEHHFGLWHSDYVPKLAAEALIARYGMR